jgi:hypothetical protein
MVNTRRPTLESKPKKIEEKMSLGIVRVCQLYAIVLMVCSVLVACSAQTLSSTQLPAKPVKVASEISPSITPTAMLKINTTYDPIVRSYHTLLMLERSADLMLAVIVKIQKGEISQGDSTAISPYTDAFSVTVETLNEVFPPAEFEDPWNQVLMAAQQYSQAYTMINASMAISSRNLEYLKETRKLLTIDQQMFEAYFLRNGSGSGFFVAQKEVVDQHLQQLYGDWSIPALQP